MKTIQRTQVDDPSDSLPEEHHNYNNGTVYISYKSQRTYCEPQLLENAPRQIMQ